VKQAGAIMRSVEAPVILLVIFKNRTGRLSSHETEGVGGVVGWEWKGLAYVVDRRLT